MNLKLGLEEEWMGLLLIERLGGKRGWGSRLAWGFWPEFWGHVQ